MASLYVLTPVWLSVFFAGAESFSYASPFRFVEKIYWFARLACDGGKVFVHLAEMRLDN